MICFTVRCNQRSSTAYNVRVQQLFIIHESPWIFKLDTICSKFRTGQLFNLWRKGKPTNQCLMTMKMEKYWGFFGDVLTKGNLQQLLLKLHQ